MRDHFEAKEESRVSFPKSCERVCVTSPDAQPRRRIQATAQRLSPQTYKKRTALYSPFSTSSSLVHLHKTKNQNSYEPSRIINQNTPTTPFHNV